MPAPTLTRASSTPAATASSNSNNTQQAPAALIPFTRAARKKSRLIGIVSKTLTSSVQQLAPIQIPANGYLRNIILDVEIAATGNSASVAYNNDAPFNVLQNVSLQAANGDSLINPLDGFSLYAVNKYGCFSRGVYDPLRSPTYAKTTGTGSTGGSAQFQVNIPVEVDARDALGSLPNMAANQSFLLNIYLNNEAGVYSTSPTAAPTVTITMTAEYWAAPAASNASGVAQQTAPRCANAVSLIQTQQPPITASTDQNIQLLQVGNTIRWIMCILRDSSGDRDSSDWPNQTNLLVNNDYWYYKTKANWENQMAQDYGLTAGVANTPTLNSLDTGVFVFTDFMNDGSSGDNVAQGSSNRDLMLVTGSATALYLEANSWGSSASSLNVITNSLRVPDPSSFYAPLGI